MEQSLIFLAGFAAGLVVWAFFAARAKAVEASAVAELLALKTRIRKAASDLGPGGTQPPPPAA